MVKKLFDYGQCQAILFKSDGYRVGYVYHRKHDIGKDVAEAIKRMNRMRDNRKSGMIVTPIARHAHEMCREAWLRDNE